MILFVLFSIPFTTSWVIIWWAFTSIFTSFCWIVFLEKCVILIFIRVTKFCRDVEIFIGWVKANNSWFKPNVVFNLCKISVFEVHWIFSSDVYRSSTCNDIINLLLRHLLIVILYGLILKSKFDLLLEVSIVYFLRSKVPYYFWLQS